MLEAFKTLSHELQRTYEFSTAELISVIKHEDTIPATAFDSKLTPFESAARYLEQNGKSITQIAATLGRPPSVIMRTLSHSKRKQAVLVYADTEYSVPATLFSDKTLSFSENLCTYLQKRYTLSNAAIAKLVGLDQRTVWTVLSRAAKKRGEQR